MVLDRRHEDWHPTNPSSTSRTSHDTKRNTLPLWRFATETTGSHSREWSTARDNGSRLVLYRCWAGLRLATRQSLPCVSPPPLQCGELTHESPPPPPPLVRKQQSLRASPALVGTSAIGPHVSERSEWDANRLDITIYCPSCSSDVQRVRLSRRSCMMRVESL